MTNVQNVINIIIGVIIAILILVVILIIFLTYKYIPGKLEANPTSLNFTNIPVLGNSTQKITLTNTGTGLINIEDIYCAGAQFSATGPQTPLTLTYNETMDINVTFKPVQVGTYDGVVVVSYKESQKPIEIPLTGTSVSTVGFPRYR